MLKSVSPSVTVYDRPPRYDSRVLTAIARLSCISYRPGFGHNLGYVFSSCATGGVKITSPGVRRSTSPNLPRFCSANARKYPFVP